VSAEDVYHEALVRLARAATGEGRLERADGAATVDNPLCGDEVTVEVALRDGRVAALAHRVRGCLLCRAAAAVLGSAAPGASLAELARAGDELAALLRDGAPAPAGAFAALAAFTPVRAVPSRHRCALLPFEALRAALARAKG
jgi:nitrogen fixation NifU-like protein